MVLYFSWIGKAEEQSRGRNIVEIEAVADRGKFGIMSDKVVVFVRQFAEN